MMGTGKHRRPAQRARDRKRIGELYLKGWLQADIVKEVGVSQPTVSRDLKALHKVWLESALMDFNEAKGRELAKVDHLELEYWDAWKRSQADKETHVSERIAGGTTEDRDKVQIRTEGQVGNPAFLAGVQWCIDKRCKILGLDAAEKHDLRGAGGGPIEHRITGGVRIFEYDQEETDSDS